jgi:hypothetical protein
MTHEADVAVCERLLATLMFLNGATADPSEFDDKDAVRGADQRFAWDNTSTANETGEGLLPYAHVQEALKIALVWTFGGDAQRIYDATLENGEGIAYNATAIARENRENTQAVRDRLKF